jgi:hypothetical protein
VAGDINDLDLFLRRNSLGIDAFASCDVLEHIYSAKDFLLKLSELPGRLCSVVMSSHANDSNPLIRYIIQREQFTLEHKQREIKWGHKERDSLQAYPI